MELAGELLEAQQQIGSVLESLIKGRLLVSEKHTIDLAHEALIKGWQKLHGWCQENRELRRLKQRIEDAYAEWLRKNKSDGYLLQRGWLLETKEQWEYLEFEFSEDVIAFYKHSDDFEKEQALYRKEIERLKWWLQKIQTKINESLHEARETLNSTASLESINKHLSQILEIKAALDVKRNELDEIPGSFDLVKFNEELSKFEEGVQRFNERMKNSHFAANWLDSPPIKWAAAPSSAA